MFRLFILIALALTPVGGTARGHYHHHTLAADREGYYTNVSGHQIHRPSFNATRPAGATARCGDGSWSYSEHHQGTCSHHGGVATWLR